MSDYLAKIIIAILLFNFVALLWFIIDSALRRRAESKLPRKTPNHPLRRRTDKPFRSGEMS